MMEEMLTARQIKAAYGEIHAPEHLIRAVMAQIDASRGEAKNRRSECAPVEKKPVR